VLADAPAVEDLLVRSDVAADEAAASLAAGGTVVLPGAEAMLATATVSPLDGGWGLLRSVAVDPSVRGRGLGALAVSAAAAQARDTGVRSLALFTHSATEFFARLGFAVTAHNDLPGTVQTTRQARECASDTAMTLEVGTAP
jgi:amino-acid N-acetyltransferase